MKQYNFFADFAKFLELSYEAKLMFEKHLRHAFEAGKTDICWFKLRK